MGNGFDDSLGNEGVKDGANAHNAVGRRALIHSPGRIERSPLDAWKESSIRVDNVLSASDDEVAR
jgi:hypothetical protein